MNEIDPRGVWNCIEHELRQMREQGSGAIVNCSSIGGLTANSNRAIYGAAKFSVIGHVLVVDGGHTA